MARRVQKFNLVRMFLLIGAMIWLPQLIKPLAGVPDQPVETPVEQPSSPEPRLVDQKPIDVRPVTETKVEPPASDNDFFDLDQIAPAPAEFVLNETLVGATGKSAIINGRAYREGEMLSVAGWTMRLRSIHASAVLLEADGRVHELKKKLTFREYFSR